MIPEEPFIDREYATEKEAKLGVMAAGYRFCDVEIYQIGNRLIRWRFRLTEEAKAGEAASTAEPMPRKLLADNASYKPPIQRRRLSE